MSKERRRHQRFDVRATFYESDVTHTVTSISEGGVYVETSNRPYYVGTPLRFILSLDEFRTVHATGTVVRARTEGIPGNGIRFDELGRLDEVLLHGYLASRPRY
jgi:hypothetical protein